MSELSQQSRSALKAAQLYYLQDLTMEAIAAELRTSRSTVSRLLAYARQTGLVDIQVRSPLDQATRIQRQIHMEFGVATHIVPVPEGLSEVDRLERVAMSAARILTQFMDSNSIIGVAWGSTMSAVSRHLVSKPTHNSQLVQLNGAGNPRSTGISYASEILQRFGEAFGCSVQQFPVPAFFDDPDTKRAMWRERSIQRVLDVQSRMDLALFSLGSPSAEVPSHVYKGGYLGDADFAQLRQLEVVGDIATVFFRSDGTHSDIPMNERASGPDLALLRSVARRVCVVSGKSKLPALRGAIAAGLISDLVVDESTARGLVSAGA